MIIVKMPMQIDRELIRQAYDQNLICAPQLEVGKFILVDVVKEVYLIPNTASVISSQQYAQKAANAHNKYKGISDAQADKLISKSMKLCVFKLTKNDFSI